jgi:osmotically-inducible protein OsmY
VVAKMKNNNIAILAISVIAVFFLVVLAVWAFSSEDFYAEVRSDDDIRDAVNQQLLLDGRVDAGNVEVEINDSVANLSGSVEDFTAYNAAEDNALSVNGVTTVINDLEIDYTPSEDVDISDATLENTISEIFFYDNDLESQDIFVEVNDGEVELSGEVDALWRKLDAEEEAEDVIGVTSVDNKLAVVPTDDVYDESIAENIVSSLTNNFYTNAEEIDVIVESNNVTLEGTVDSAYEYQVAEDIASFTDGVIAVENDLIIE